MGKIQRKLSPDATFEALSDDNINSCAHQSEFPVTQNPNEISVQLAAPRGFCAGVTRAIRTVEEALKIHGTPVYVRHEIVHNTHVVNRLKAMGAIFTDDLTMIPKDRPLILSAHGSPKEIVDNVTSSGQTLIDATCPLVTKVHVQTRQMVARGYHIVLIGHMGHQEVSGTMGQGDPQQISLIETAEQARTYQAPQKPLAYVTQTTLSVDDTEEILSILKNRFPDIQGPSKADICYATTNRQQSVKAISKGADLVVVIGMVEVAKTSGAKHAILVDGPEGFDWKILDGVKKLGLSAGASAPEELVEDFLAILARHYPINIDTLETAIEHIAFKMPPTLS